jgi:polysaccharide export outer membrane protein
LQDEKENVNKNEFVNVRPEKTIQPFDNLYVRVSSIDEKTANIFSDQSRGVSGPNIDLISYTVNSSGYIEFPFVGSIYVKDFTLAEAQKAIEENVSEYLNNISITVKFVNNTVSVLGDVRQPGEYTFYKDQVTIFQALSFAGGFGDYGDKTDVLLIREANNKINYYKLDLTDKNVVESKYYYIIPNDVILVNSIKTKYRNMGLLNWPLFLTTLTTFTTIYLLFYRN